MIKGMDVSMLNELENLGAIYYDEGKEKDIFSIFLKYNINTIRLRVWDNPYDDNGSPYGAGTNDLRTLIKLSKRVKAHKFKFILDIHYSDFWTDRSEEHTSELQSR